MRMPAAASLAGVAMQDSRSRRAFLRRSDFSLKFAARRGPTQPSAIPLPVRRSSALSARSDKRNSARDVNILFDRAESYLGVMIDDLTTKGVTEPYRIFTSRAEFRLSLRADNADERLTGKGIALGCVGARRAAIFKEKSERLRNARRLLESCIATPAKLAAAGIPINQDGVRRNAFELAAYPTIAIADLARIWPELSGIAPPVLRRLEADAKYSVYLERQDEDAARFRRGEAIEIPPDLDYDRISGLSNELRDKFRAVRPSSVGQASRIEGMTPAALALVAAHARRPPPRKAVRR